MSALKIFAPELDDLEHPEFRSTEANQCSEIAGSEEEPQVFSLRTYIAEGKKLSLMELLTRSRVLHRNRICKHCTRPTVEPLDDGDHQVGKNRLPIPGTSTIRGFVCQYCRHEWSA